MKISEMYLVYVDDMIVVMNILIISYLFSNGCSVLEINLLIVICFNFVCLFCLWWICFVIGYDWNLTNVLGVVVNS